MIDWYIYNSSGEITSKYLLEIINKPQLRQGGKNWIFLSYTRGSGFTSWARPPAETDTSASFHFLRGQKETKNNVVSWTPQEEAVSEKLLQREQTTWN